MYNKFKPNLSYWQQKKNDKYQVSVRMLESFSLIDEKKVLRLRGNENIRRCSSIVSSAA